MDAANGFSNIFENYNNDKIENHMMRETKNPKARHGKTITTIS